MYKKLMSILLVLAVVSTCNAQLLQEEQHTINVFRQISPKVVFIHRLATVVDPFKQQMALKQAGSGSGIIWDNKGHVVTNFHVIKGADKFQITINDNFFILKFS